MLEIKTLPLSLLNQQGNPLKHLSRWLVLCYQSKIYEKLTAILPNFRIISFWYKKIKRIPALCKFEGRLCFKVTAYDYALNRLWSKAGSATNRVPTDTSSERKLRRDIQSTMFQTVINFGRRCFMLLMLVCHLFTRTKLIERVKGWQQSVRRVGGGTADFVYKRVQIIHKGQD